MSIVYTADVFCDECNQWTHGVTSSRPPTKESARLTAARSANWKHVNGKDYCPVCWKKATPAPSADAG